MKDPCDSSRSGAALTIDVARHAGDWAWLAPLDDLVERTAEAVAAAAPDAGQQVVAALALSDDANVRQLNRDWRSLDKPTNVLSFPAQRPPRGTPHPHPIGDIVIAEQTLLAEAGAAGIPPLDHFRHLLVHGLLHLQGYDHEHDEDAQIMEALETSILAALGVPDPYAGTEPVEVTAR